MRVWNFRSLIIFSAFLRVFLIVYGEWQDAQIEVRYTDVDYLVFSDAAALVVAGKSPYKRSTYRYSPLIAFLLAPNSFIHRSWGKFIFSVSGREKQQRSRLLDGSSEFVLTYEDKEGNWMLAGDVPWRMFLSTVKRLRIMKTSDAIGLAPRYQEKNQKPKR